MDNPGSIGRETLLFIDDELNILSSLERLFCPLGYNTLRAESGADALTLLEKETVDLIICDMRMPGMNGAEVLEQARARWPDIARILLTGSPDLDSTIAAINRGEIYRYISKPWNDHDVVLVVRDALERKRLLSERQRLEMLTHQQNEELKALNASLEDKVRHRTNELDRANDLLVYLLALAGEMRDNETGYHVTRVGRYSRILAEGAGMPTEFCFLIEKAALLHDIGKIGISDHILHKKAKLSERERKTMRLHTTNGLQLLGGHGHDSMLIQMAASIAMNHHECWDGTGYPRGEKGEVIPIEGRIVAIADVFDALTTRRPYKKPWPVEKVIAFMSENAGKQFDPALISAFMANIEKFVQVMREFHDFGKSKQPILSKHYG